MIFDATLLLSKEQAVTATAPSANVIDLRPTSKVYGAAANLKRDKGRGFKIPLAIHVVEAFATLTSLTIAAQTSDDPAFGSGVVTHASTGAIAQADLKAGYVSSLDVLPSGGSAGMKRYFRLLYTVAGSNATAGKITAGITMGNQTNDNT